MDFSFKAVTEYVKNLFPGCAPVQVSDNRELDMQVLASLCSNCFYTVASNGHRYWYYFTAKEDVPVAQHILHSNGVKVMKHKSKYYQSNPDVLRIRRKKLDENFLAATFVDELMCLDKARLDMKRIKSRISLVKQKVK